MKSLDITQHAYELSEYQTKDAITDRDAEPLIHETRSSSLAPAHKSPLALFRQTLWLGFATATTVLILNICMLAYAIFHSGSLTVAATIYEGECNTSKRISLALSLLVNILSTLLLGSSNNAAQYLSSPTRAEVDAAHAELTWMDIGIPSIRNLRRISTTRVWLWFLLFCSSFPLHLVLVTVIGSRP
jgi:hypothetical protein